MGGAEFVGQCEQVTKLLAETLQRNGGSISAEHGIGLVKKAYLSLTRSIAEIEVMRGIRRVLDPQGIMNSGKLFDSRKPKLESPHLHGAGSVGMGFLSDGPPLAHSSPSSPYPRRG